MDIEDDIRQSLVPSRRNTLTTRPNGYGDQKRKREQDEHDEPSDWFEAKVLSAQASQRPSSIHFIPVTTLLRAHVPLAWLGASLHGEAIPLGTVFEADITNVLKWDYHLLIARHAPNGGLYAIERVEETTFVCYPLKTFVTIDHVQQAAIGATPPVSVVNLLRSASACHTRKTSIASVQSSGPISITPQSPKLPQNRRGILARQSILLRDKTVEPPEAGKQGTNSIIATDALEAGPAEKAAADGDAPSHDLYVQPPGQESSAVASDDVNLGQEAREVLETTATTCSSDRLEPVDQLSAEYLRKRYLEVLYLSQTSLAFFAKGPLSRTRARARVCGASMTTEQLISFYRESILTSKKLDLKYKESIQAKILSLSPLPNATHVDEEANGPQKSPNKTKKSRRLKLDKRALWPMEDEFIENWWRRRASSSRTLPSADAVNTEMKHAVSLLRMREFELQVILILEVLALEAKDAAKQQNSLSSAPDPDIKIETIEHDDEQAVAKALTNKKRKDLNSDLEALLDRLCIWHSIGLDEDLVPMHKDQEGGARTTASTRDRLRDFCKDVVIPFYATKLPLQSKIICQKLGGPEFSPQRTKTSTDRFVTRVLPGAAIHPRDRISAKRTLERVLSEDHSSRNATPPVLSRSSTLPAAPNLKLEASEKPTSRVMRKSMSFTNREIDLVADAKATAAKRRKLEVVATQKRELQAAIEALKKPNRHMAGQDLMDEMERRARVKKIEPVQITATPRKTTSKASPFEEYDLPPMINIATTVEDTFIPSSTGKTRGLAQVANMMRGSAKKREVITAIRDMTSSRSVPDTSAAYPGTASGLRVEHVDRDHSSSTLVGSTPAKSRVRTDLLDSLAIENTPTRSKSHRQLVFSTPVKRAEATVDALGEMVEIPERANKMMERVMQAKRSDAEASIYDSLGWNDDDDDI